MNEWLVPTRSPLFYSLYLVNKGIQVGLTVQTAACEVSRGELVFYAIFQPYLVIYGGQFRQLEKLNGPGSDPATFH